MNYFISKIDKSNFDKNFVLNGEYRIWVSTELSPFIIKNK